MLSHHIRNPSIHLSCLSTKINPNMFTSKHLISYGIISWSRQNIDMAASMQTYIVYHIQDRNVGMLRSNKHVIISNTFMLIKARLKSNLQTNACLYECMPYLTYLTTPQHLCINAWLYHMHVHGISNKEKKRNPSLTCEG